MRAWEMHPLCCLAGEWPASGGGHAPPEPAAEGEAPTVAGVLYKWPNIGKGWRPRWFAIRGGVLAYSKIRRRVAAEPHPAPEAAAADGIRLIGVVRGSSGERPIGFMHLKVQPLITLFGFLNKGIKLRSERCQKNFSVHAWRGQIWI